MVLEKTWPPIHNQGKCLLKEKFENKYDQDNIEDGRDAADHQPESYLDEEPGNCELFARANNAPTDLYYYLVEIINVL